MAKQLGHRHSSNFGSLDYLLYLPKEYREDSATPWPLMLFLHGRGESGSDLNLIKRHGIPKVIDEADDFDCITISPQCPEDTDWVSLAGLLISLLNETIDGYRIDRQRMGVVLARNSLGALGKHTHDFVSSRSQ